MSLLTLPFELESTIRSWDFPVEKTKGAVIILQTPLFKKGWTIPCEK
jgi:hypothetical protein